LTDDHEPKKGLENILFNAKCNDRCVHLYTLFDYFWFHFFILKESLPNFFVIDSEFSVKEIEKNQMYVHPDVKLGLKIKSLQSSNKNIGSSHLCCCTCERK
jgi:hypothetical protein